MVFSTGIPLHSQLTGFLMAISLHVTPAVGHGCAHSVALQQTCPESVHLPFPASTGVEMLFRYGQQESGWGMHVEPTIGPVALIAVS